VRVIRNDAFDPLELIAERPRALVISPGPGTPGRAGRCIDLIRANESIPLLGVCLGHQALAEAFGAQVVRGELPVHGKVSEVSHRGQRLFEGCPARISTARYHSLVVDRQSLPGELVVDAETAEGTIMALSHRTRPLFGIQFHPESYGTSGGDQLILNFLRSAGMEAKSKDEEVAPGGTPGAYRAGRPTHEGGGGR
jgi:anthranilate synthase component II